MGDNKIPLTPLMLKKEGTFKFNRLIESLKRTLKERQYVLEESKYMEKDATPQGKEITTKITASKKIDEYTKYEIVYELQFSDFHMRGDENHAQVKIVISPQAIYDYQEYNKHSTRLSKLYNWFFHYEKTNLLLGGLAGDFGDTVHTIKRELNYEL